MENKSDYTAKPVKNQSYYKNVFIQYLKDHHIFVPEDIIVARVDMAAESFEVARRSGHSVQESEELAIEALMTGYTGMSIYDLLYDVVTSEFSEEISPVVAPAFTEVLLQNSEIMDVFNRNGIIEGIIPIDDDNTVTDLKTELIGTIVSITKIETYKDNGI